MDASKIVIAGGTGLIGSLLRSRFEDQGREVVVLSRSEGKGQVKWDGRTHGFWAQSLEGADAVINLSGVSVAMAWTEKNKRLIEDSRVQPTQAIAEAVRKCGTPPRVWINASAVGFYGDAGSREVSEATRAGSGFMGELCKKWESACLSEDTPRTRKVVARLGVVLDRNSPFIKAASMAAKFGVGGALGSGKQYVSWVHSQDVLRMFEWCLYEPVTGPINVCAPYPVTNSEFMAALRRMYFRPPVPGVPAGLLKLFAGLVGKESEVLLTGQRAVPEIALSRGFRFKFERVEHALADVLNAVPEAWKTA
ncbi:MAG: TIGR01777 family oxidoreductase [Fimbriimonadaceae bacterium]